MSFEATKLQPVATKQQKEIAMTKCCQTEGMFPACKSRNVQLDFHGGDVTSDAGLLLLRQMDRQAAWKMHEVLVDQFIASHPTRPKELILDIDATDDRVHGQQQGRFFHGYYDHYCFLPLYVFCGDQLLVSDLRPSNIDGARHSWAVLSLLIKRLRQKWPKVRIVVRGDSGFCRWRMLRWFERNQVKYVIGLARNDRLARAAEHLHQQAADDYEVAAEKHTCFGWVQYGALSWDRERRVIAKAKHGPQGSNPRYVVSNLQGSAERIYRKVYCAQGEMENRIKEQQLHLFSDRTSCHRWWANQFRLLLSVRWPMCS